MNAEHKLEIFKEKALNEAEEKRKELESNVKLELEKACADITAKAEREASEAIKRERIRLEQMLNRELSEAKIKAKLARAQLTAELEDKVFEVVTKRIAEFRETKEYEDYLINGINEAISEFGQGMTVYLCPSDSHLKAVIAEKTQIPIAESGNDFAGGFIATILGGSMSLDNTFETRLNEARSNFRGGFHKWKI